MPTELVTARPADFVEFRKESILQGIHQRFEEQVRLHPKNIALKTQAAAHTYAETNGFANSIAAEILSATGKELAQVGLLLPNTPELVIAIMASLKAHKAYVPLGHNFPIERLRVMLEDADPVVLLTDDEHLELAQQLAGNKVRIINTSKIKRHADAPNPQVPCDPLDRAYILYTSGSTGKPKGITFLHRNLLHTTMCLTNELFFSSSDRVTWLHSPSFGSSVVDIYCCLTNGATLCPWDTKTQGFTGMADWLIRETVTTFQWIPSAFRQFMRTVPNNTIFQNIRIVIMAGEPLTIREVELFRRHFPRGSHLVNQVGTAESYNYHLYRVDHDIPIENANVAGGYPVSADRQVLILDDELRELHPQSVGEIAIRSDYMSGGYWRDEALTQKQFVKIGTDPTPVYLTGDLGKLESDGCLIHLGRKDFQVKIRGCRIEVAEVEHFLTSAPGVADSAVWVAKNRLDEDQLVGYVVLKESGEFHQPQVERHLGSQLPDYMVPRHYVLLDSLPALPTGKVNRKGLPNPFEKNEFENKTPSTQPEMEQQEIVGIFRELLQLEEIRPDSNFLKLGGDSLLAAVLMHRIHQRFGVEIDYEQFVVSPTPAHLADLIKAPIKAVVKPRSSPPLLESSNFPERMTRMAQRETVQISTRGRKKNLIIISAGRFGREAFVWATQAMAHGARLNIKGFLDSRRDALDGYDYEPGIIGSVEDYIIEKDDVFVGAIGDPRDKVTYYTPILKRGGRFINLIHPLANIGQNVQLGSGIVLGPFASVTCDVKIGDHVSIGAFSNAAHDTVIGNWSQISSHCGINGNASLGEGVFLGSHACIIPWIKVGDWAFVGAGSVVIREVPPGVKVFGNPAAVIGKAGPR
jgi:sugar O-acyltransferase (sialic acid O-acetyltransferase NeuD family)